MIKKLRILGIDYPVVFTDLHKLGGNNNAGCADSTGCKIFISNAVNSDQHQRSVLLHEIIEALTYRLELNLEHRQITQLEAGLFSVFRDNPELLPLIVGRTTKQRARRVRKAPKPPDHKRSKTP